MFTGAIQFLRDSKGAMAVETALVAPLLAVMSIGTYEVGTMVSRQQELQSAAGEAEAIILAAASSATIDSATIDDIIETSLGLNDDQVTLNQRFRCNTASSIIADPTSCNVTQPIYQYVELTVTDSYTPLWTQMGVGSAFNYSVVRTVQVR
ncbi:TadE/TadG family type IV pilus assembly protein [Altererythrobacter aquiaggeris]|uniref:TadE/TadG family type IV pilus assembly protein n=1 Tax=Aestuarierythrobacter aquiaggeris TaxID=1898396 RepID=UPI003017ED72